MTIVTSRGHVEVARQEMRGLRRGSGWRWFVEILNDRFGTDLTDIDKLLLDQFEESWVADGELSDQAQSNSIENFRLVFDRKFLQTIVTRMDANSEIFKRILDEEDFRNLLGDYYLKKVYQQLRDAA